MYNTIACLIFAMVLLFSCKNDAYTPICIDNYSHEEMVLYLDSISLDRSFLLQAENIGAYNTDSCFRCYELVEVKHDNLLQHLKNTSFEQVNLHSIKDFAKNMYLLSPEALYPDYLNEGYSLTEDSDELLGRLASGELAPLCFGLSEIFGKLIIEKSSNKVQASLLKIQQPIHVVNLLKFSQDGRNFALTVDIQNGILGPFLSKDSSLIDLDSLPFIQGKDVYLEFFSDEILRSKRNLCKSVFPCNFLADSKDTYFRLKANSGLYTMERRSYPINFYVWVKRGVLDMEDYKQELLLLMKDSLIN